MAVREESEGITWARHDERGRARVCLKVLVVVVAAWGRRRRWDILFLVVDWVCVRGLLRLSDVVVGWRIEVSPLSFSLLVLGGR